RATDASVAYDARHNVWLISSLTLLEAGGVHGNAVVTSRSSDGLVWTNPVTTASGGDLDKNWIVCDNTPSSPFYGRCYTEWDDHGADRRHQQRKGPLHPGPRRQQGHSRRDGAARPLLLLLSVGQHSAERWVHLLE